MLGQRLMPESHHAIGELIPPEQLREALASMAANIDSAVGKLPTHQQFLDGLNR